MDFAVSCSIDPGYSKGRAAIRMTGLRSLPADYHTSNYYPQVEDRVESRYGAFIQLWTTHRTGRIAAFTDSTVFSNFSTFEPGKAELMLGMLEWLNHREPSQNTQPLWIGLGLLLMAASVVSARQWPGATFVLLSALLFGVALGGMAVRAVHRRDLPTLQPVRPYTRVVVDQTVCDPILSTSGFIAGEKTGFGIFERWLLRLGYFTTRRQGDDIFTSDALVFLYPSREVPLQFRTQLSDYVRSGGKVLIVDSPANAGSTANALLHPFGMSILTGPSLSGSLETPQGWPSGVTIEEAGEIKGGTSLIQLNGKPVAATVRQGEGTVTAVSFGSRFSDFRMGVTGDIVPDPQLRKVYDLQFQLMRSIIGPAQ
jgi:hypothetical protein